MPRLCLLGLILVGFLMVQTLAETHRSETDPSELVSHQTQSSISSEADHPVSSESDGNEDAVEKAEAPSSRRLGNHRSDKSLAGGGVIVGGLVTAIFAAVVCYIRVTRKRNSVL